MGRNNRRNRQRKARSKLKSNQGLSDDRQIKIDILRTIRHIEIAGGVPESESILTVKGLEFIKES